MKKIVLETQMKKIVLEMQELPKREHKLTSAELQNVYGGCTENGDICITNSQCCIGKCYGVDKGFFNKLLGKCLTI